MNFFEVYQYYIILSAFILAAIALIVVAMEYIYENWTIVRIFKKWWTIDRKLKKARLNRALDRELVMWESEQQDAHINAYTNAYTNAYIDAYDTQDGKSRI